MIFFTPRERTEIVSTWPSFSFFFLSSSSSSSHFPLISLLFLQLVLLSQCFIRGRGYSKKRKEKIKRDMFVVIKAPL